MDYKKDYIRDIKKIIFEKLQEVERLQEEIDCLLDISDKTQDQIGTIHYKRGIINGLLKLLSDVEHKLHWYELIKTEELQVNKPRNESF